MSSPLYSHTRRSPTAHNEQRTGERRLAVLASIRTTRNWGRGWIVAAVLAGAGIAALLTGFAMWPGIISTPSIILSFVVTIAVAWTGAMLLPKPSVGVLCFSAPIAVGIIFAAITRQWAGLGVLAGCMLVPFLSLALYKADGRRHS
jgi:hypothetical protein